LKIKEFGELVVFEHTLFSTPFIFVAMIAASRCNGDSGWFGWRLLALAALAAIFARNFAMSFNRFVDREFDAINPRTAARPSVDGRLSPALIAAFAAINAALFVAIAYFINNLAFALAAPFLAVLASYSYIKRFSYLAHLVLGLSLALAPMAGAIAVLDAAPLWAWVLSAGVLFWVAGFDLLYALQDREFDAKMGLFSIPAKFGTARTLIIARVFHAVTFICWLLFCRLADLGALAFIGAIVSGAFLVAEHIIVLRGVAVGGEASVSAEVSVGEASVSAAGSVHINRAFFVVNAWLGFVFFGFIALESVIKAFYE
jgi:4-hydroxybenzoate polyprenyltransferase